MPAPLDYASVMRGGASLVPDLRAQLMQDEAREMQREQFQMQRDLMEQRRQAALREAEEEAAYKRELELALLSGDPQSIMRLMARFPDMAEGIKPLWEQMDERQRTADLTQTGTIYARAQAGDTAGAAQVLRQRVEADRAAGAVDPADEAVLAGLESDDPIQQRAALATIGIQLAALTGDKFSETYGKLNPSETTPAIQREVDYYRSIGRDDLAELALRNKADPVVFGEPGAPVYRTSDIQGAAGAQPRGGDPSTGGQGVTPPAEGPLGPWIEQTAGLSASPHGRQRASGVAGTYHADDNARDFPTPTLAANVAEGRRLKQLFGPAFDVLYSETDASGEHNDHVHVEPGPALGAQVRGRGSSPVRVSSVQQANALAPGTEYETPDGRRFVR